jgi:PAS domain S-box-containing protein
VRSALLEESMRNGRATASGIVDIVQYKNATVGEKGVLIFLPVYRDGKSFGFVTMAIAIDNLIAKQASDNVVSLKIDMLSDKPTRQVHALVQPIFAFGKSFEVRAIAGRGFLILNPTQAGWIVGFMGVFLTLALGVVVGLTVRRRTRLQQLVSDRTQELQISEAKLKSSEQNFRTFFETLDDMAFIANQQGQIFSANQAVLKKLGYSAEELAGMHVLAVHPQEKRVEAEQIFGEMFAGKRDFCPLPLARKNGEKVSVETRVWFGRWDDKDCIFGVSKDLSAQEEALQKFNALFDYNPALMAVTSLETIKYENVNAAFLQALGYTRDEVIAKTTVDLNIAVQPELLKAYGEKLMKCGHISNVELQVRTKSGTILDGLFSGSLVITQNKQYMLTVMHDITDRKNAEREKFAMQNQVAHAQRLASIGELAAGVGHEINNPLSIISGYVEILADTLAESEDASALKQIAAINKAIERIRNIVSGLRTYARTDEITGALLTLIKQFKKRFR